MHVVDIMNPNSSNVRYANVLSYVNVVAISSSGEALAMVDNECNIHLWGSLSKIRFNEISVPTEMPPEEQPAPMMDWSHDTIAPSCLQPSLPLQEMARYVPSAPQNRPDLSSEHAARPVMHLPPTLALHPAEMVMTDAATSRATLA